ncbi:nucleoside triphosphate pyrophosphohydrolase [Alphaproteobacteria bacterium]|nr:nucleoside triphosphate pyrophosphohydrolase [Alphaproteobacteria bacterium]
MKIDKLVKIMEKLRDPNRGCPWDKKQTMESIITHTIEEAYEVAEQIHNKNYNELKEELGDLLFQVVYLSQIASEKNKFNFFDVVESITSKMISRHPHVFKNKKFKNMKEFKLWWEKSKKKKQLSILDNIPFTYPAYLEANKIQKKVASVGFDYKNKFDAIDKISEELEELKIEIKAQNQSKIKEELGDLIFATLDVSRKLKLDPEIILKKANNKFSKRWRKLESLAKKENLNLNKLSLKNYDLLWNKAKKK